MEKRWNPWAALRDQPELELALVDLPAIAGGAFYAPQPEGWAAILIDRRRSRRDRRALLAHELVHHERGGGCPTSDMPSHWTVVARREEARVNIEVARRLVPLDELRAFLDRMSDSELAGATARDIADQFDVTEEIALLAVQQLQ